MDEQSVFSNEVEMPENGTADGWKNKIKEEQKYWTEFHKEASDIEARYRNADRLKAQKARGHRKFSILWSNTEVLKTAVYAKAPEPQVSRRFKDKDPVGRAASEVLERCLVTTQDLQDDDAEYKRVRDDLLLPGRGQARVRYEADITPATEEQAGEVRNERCILEHYHRDDFVHGRARSWKKVPWVAFGVWLTEDQFEKRFPDIDMSFAPEDVKEKGGEQISEEVRKANEGKARVWEIWDKTSKKVYWITDNHHDILEESDPPINFRNFFPCPPPVTATMSNDTLVPVADYVFYKDQAEVVDDLTGRISKLTAALKVVGFYPAGDDNSGTLESVFSSHIQNRMIPIASWAAFTDKGGSAGAIQWLPIEQVAQTLTELIALRRQMIDDIYQITGISDILRGATAASETATAQQIKAEWGGVRIRDKQTSLAEFGRHVQELKSEIIAEVFSIETLKLMSGLALPTEEMKQQYQMQVQQHQQMAQLMQQSGAQVPPPPEEPQWLGQPTWEEVKQLLNDERSRGFRIDVETDSTIMQDAAIEKAARNEFLAAVGAYIQQAMPVVMQAPQIAEVVGEMLLFTVRGYRAGRELEEKIEESVEQLKGMAQQAVQAAANPEPDPLMQAEVADKQASAQLKGAQAQKAQAEAQAAAQPEQTAQGNPELDAADRQLKAGEMVMQKQKQDNDMALQAAKMAAQREDRELRHREVVLGEATKQEQARKGAMDDILRMLTTLDARLDKIEAARAKEEQAAAPKISDALNA
jgi:hypothetical protein